jgi:hypothetical protein
MRRCYRESYFDGVYYDAEALRLLISEGKQYSAIALNESGEVVAHIGLRNPRRGRTADSTMAIVDPRYRSRGLLDFIISDPRSILSANACCVWRNHGRLCFRFSIFCIWKHEGAFQ